MRNFFIGIICVLMLVGCTNQIKELPDCWEYFPGKWICFKEVINLEWHYDNAEDVKFQISKVKIQVSDEDIKEIKKLIKKNNVEGLISKERMLRKTANNNQEFKSVNTIGSLNFKDSSNPSPTFNELIIYNVNALKNTEMSNPATLSVFIIDRS